MDCVRVQRSWRRRSHDQRLFDGVARDSLQENQLETRRQEYRDGPRVEDKTGRPKKGISDPRGEGVIVRMGCDGWVAAMRGTDKQTAADKAEGSATGVYDGMPRVKLEVQDTRAAFKLAASGRVPHLPGG